jgi:hypothetical protein
MNISVANSSDETPPLPNEAGAALTSALLAPVGCQ